MKGRPRRLAANSPGVREGLQRAQIRHPSALHGLGKAPSSDPRPCKGLLGMLVDVTSVSLSH